MLILNREQTEQIIFKPKQQVKVSVIIQFQVGEKALHVTRSVKNLGVYFDRQVNVISSACYYPIRNIGRIRQYITTDVCKTLAHALVTSRLDYGNALLYSIASTLVECLQRVQNSTAVTRTRKQ